MAGRHGGRGTDHAGTRDFTEPSSLDVLIRTMGRWGARENYRNLSYDQANCEWISVRYGIWQGLVVGKTYTFGNRKGKVVDKRENHGHPTGSKSNSGLPRVCVEWRG